VTRDRGVIDTFPGRSTIKVRLSRSLVDEVRAHADRLNIDVAVLLGDLASVALPSALEEAARERLLPHLRVRWMSDGQRS
jgi:hypothetical protein